MECLAVRFLAVKSSLYNGKNYPGGPAVFQNEKKKMFMDGVSNKYDAMNILTMKGI